MSLCVLWCGIWPLSLALTTINGRVTQYWNGDLAVPELIPGFSNGSVSSSNANLPKWGLISILIAVSTMNKYEFRTESVWCHLACSVQASCYHRCHVFWQIDHSHVLNHICFIIQFFFGGGGNLPFPTQITNTVTLNSNVMQTLM
jgi:hypothetical protein